MDEVPTWPTTRRGVVLGGASAGSRVCLWSSAPPFDLRHSGNHLRIFYPVFHLGGSAGFRSGKCDRSLGDSDLGRSALVRFRIV